jgi:inorganic triphosphatase YgiF
MRRSINSALALTNSLFTHASDACPEAGRVVEIEAKFDLVGTVTETLLVEAEMLEEFTLGPRTALTVVDEYVDTAGGDCYRAGYTCRLRASTEGAVVTLKGTDAPRPAAPDAAFRREEVEQALPLLTADRSAWPAGPARTLVERLCGAAPLARVLLIEQRRLARPVNNGARWVGTLTVDHVSPKIAGSKGHDYTVVEFELGPQGTEDDLTRVDDSLARLPGLMHSQSSKFARGLELLASSAPAAL